MIVNLGCGYDPLPFAYLSDSTCRAIFIDVDYPDLIRHKINIIRDTPALAAIVGPHFGETSGEIRSEKYYAVGCDLSNLTFFDKVLREVQPNLDDVDILFISEVAITYMVRT
jgi:tRNA wybutosine-synthesizing protein 4